MKKTKTSLRTGFLMTILICWLVPIFIVVALAGVLLNENYRQSVQQEIDSSAANALRLVQMRFEDAIDDSKAVSYDGTVRDAYRTWLQNGDSAGLYGIVTDYLSQSFTRGEIYQAVFIHFWNVDASAYVLSDGTTSFGLLRQCRECAPQIMAEMEDADTDIRLLLIDGQMYMARNLLDSTFTPYASVVMLLQPGNLFLPLDSVNRVGNLQYSLDGYRFTIAADGSLVEAAEETGNVHYQAKTEGHIIGFSADREEYDIFGENPWMRWAIGSVVLQGAVNGLGSDIVAAQTAGGKAAQFLSVPLESIGTAMTTYTSQNMGAKDLGRVNRGVNTALGIGCVYSVASFLILRVTDKLLIGLFLDAGETAIMANAQSFIFWNSVFYIPLAVLIIYRYTIQGLGFSGLAMFAGVAEMVARAMVGFWFVPLWGYFAACIASPVAWFFACFFLIPAYFVVFRKLQKEKQQEAAAKAQ